MIDVTRGNLLDAEADAVVNTVNCVGVMGKGIALQFKRAYPQNFRAYKEACDRGEVRMGQMLVVPAGGLTSPKYIINFPTKRHWRARSQLADIDAGLRSLVAEVQRLGVRSIALPPLGCGNGGLDWRDVRPRIERAFAALPDVHVVLFEPAGSPPAESTPIGTKRPTMTRGRATLIALMERYRGLGYRLTLLEIQKLAYLLQVAGEPLHLRYVKDKFGPYAAELNRVLQAMEGHYTRGYGDRSRRAEIVTLPDAVKHVERVLAINKEPAARLDRVARLIEGFESPFGVELLATVHWVADECGAAEGVDLDAVLIGVHAWNARKRQLFAPREVGIRL